MWVGWHVDGISWDRYLRLTWVERYLLHDEIGQQIERTDGEIPTRPKDLR